MATGRIGTTPVLRTRWSKEPAGGTTSLSGLDDNSVSLVYEVGYEAVYQNGALLSRGNDYTATDGTTITLTNATVAGDIIEVFANNVVPLTDTYSQSVADGKFVNNTIVDAKGDLLVGTAADTPGRLAVGTNGQYLKADSTTGTGLAWATLPSSGKVLQVVNSNITTYVQISSTTLTDTNITATITPSSTTSKILVMISACVRTHCDTASNNSRVATALFRGATEIQSYGDNTGDGRYLQVAPSTDVFTWVTTHYLDSPNTTSATTYKLQARQVATGDNRYAEFQLSSEPSIITLLEIGA